MRRPTPARKLRYKVTFTDNTQRWVTAANARAAVKECGVDQNKVYMVQRSDGIMIKDSVWRTY